MRNEPTKLDAVEVKVGLLRTGLNIERWARNHRYVPSSVWRAVHKSHAGRVSERIRKQLRAELGL